MWALLALLFTVASAEEDVAQLTIQQGGQVVIGSNGVLRIGTGFEAPPSSPPSVPPPLQPIYEPCVPSFEGGGWTASGTAFSNFPELEGGDYVARSGVPNAPSEAHTGTLTSDTFGITSETICWQNKGFPANELRLDVDVDGVYEVVIDARGTDGVGSSTSDGNTWGEQCIDTSSYVGKTARIVLEDNDAGSNYAWGAWKLFSCPMPPPAAPPSPPLAPLAPCVPNGDFASGYQGWTLTGSAFGATPVTWDSKVGARSVADGETGIGTMTSTPFKITHANLCWQSGGFAGTGPANYLAIDVDLDGVNDITEGSRGSHGNGPSGNSYAHQCADLTSYIGRPARVVLVDSNSGSTFAWGAWAEISCSSN